MRIQCQGRARHARIALSVSWRHPDYVVWASCPGRRRKAHRHSVPALAHRPGAADLRADEACTGATPPGRAPALAAEDLAQLGSQPRRGDRDDRQEYEQADQGRAELGLTDRELGQSGAILRDGRRGSSGLSGFAFGLRARRRRSRGRDCRSGRRDCGGCQGPPRPRWRQPRRLVARSHRPGRHLRGHQWRRFWRWGLHEALLGRERGTRFVR